MEKYRKLDLFTLELGSDLCLEKCLNEILKTIPLIREETFDKYGVVISGNISINIWYVKLYK